MTPQQLTVPRSADVEFPPRTIRDRQAASAVPHLLSPTEPLVQHQPRTIRVALAGCGVVGGGLARLLHDSAASLASRFDLRVVISSVLVRDTARQRNVPIDARLFTNDLESFLAHDADVVVEAVGGDEPARTIAISALRRGRKLITANKELIAAHGNSLRALASENDTAIDFDAAVGGGVPVISTLRDLLGASAPRSIRGILNGTSNFVISEIERGNTLDGALTAARRRGLAEVDSARDLDGRDAAAKLAIIAWTAYGIEPAKLCVQTVSLLPNLEQLVALAPSLGARLRLLAECTRLDDNRVVAFVGPVLVPESSAFARTTGEENRVEVDLGWTSPLAVSGPGAGSAPTAAALLSDLVRTSPPRNHRGVPTKFTPAIDDRGHRLLIGARIDPGAFKSLAALDGLQVTNASTHGDYNIAVVDRGRWNRAGTLVNKLQALNAAPFLSRCDVAPITGDIS
jgi:homoserine dehydrogenase